MAENSTQPDLVLGTAGHIDHGKSSLIFALTGTDPDRLSEEKERGITISLGFAQLWLPDGRFMGVVDLPGHERFVRQMISGATGIDVALLVVAADDGIMPQTVEHITILQTLGIRTCVVALTKIDLVDDPEWIDFVADDVREHLAATPYADAPIIPVSSKTREGLDRLLAAIQEAADRADRTHEGAAMRYPVDRVFTIKGAGTVTTGTLWTGTASPGDSVEILPSGKVAKIRSIQIHGKPVETAYPGNRVAINLANIKTDEIEPGDFLAQVGAIKPSDRFDAWVTYIDNDKTGKPIESGARMHIAHGTREILGRILFMNGVPELEPGESAFAQFRLEESLALSHGDRFIMRTYSPVLLAGGGTVMLAHPFRRTGLNDTEQSMLEALRDGGIQQAMELAVEAESMPVTVEFVSRLVGVEPARVESMLEEGAQAGRIVRLPGAESLFTTAQVIERANGVIEAQLDAFHKENPKDHGIAKDALRQRCYPKSTPACFDALLACAIEAGKAVASDAVVSHPDAWSRSQQKMIEVAGRFEQIIAGTGLTPPSLQEMAKECEVDMPFAKRAIAYSCDQGHVWRGNADFFFELPAIERAKETLAEHFAAGGEGTVAALRDALGTTRKYIVPLLESFDQARITKRSGDVRRLG